VWDKVYKVWVIPI